LKYTSNTINKTATTLPKTAPTVVPTLGAEEEDEDEDDDADDDPGLATVSVCVTPATHHVVVLDSVMVESPLTEVLVDISTK